MKGRARGVREEYASITDFLRVCVTECLPSPHLLSIKASKDFATKETLEEIIGNNLLTTVNNLVFPYNTDHRNPNNFLIKTRVWKEPK